MTMDLDEGSFLVRTARRAVEEYVTHRGMLPVPEDTPESLREKAGVFVTLNTFETDMLRGCIGHPYPDAPLIEALIDSAVSACARDPRFPPVRKEELGAIALEVTVLTPPEIIKVRRPDEYLTMIEVGRHGLMVRKGWYQGLLLPQVATDYGWDPEEFLCQTCGKAGLHLTAWMDDDTQVYRFEGLIFGEEKPRGPVERKG
jgi:uncharacterized protein (TIGR00296 family)